MLLCLMFARLATNTMSSTFGGSKDKADGSGCLDAVLIFTLLWFKLMLLF